MTDEMMSLRTLLEKSSDADLLREMVGFAAQRRPESAKSTPLLHHSLGRDPAVLITELPLYIEVDGSNGVYRLSTPLTSEARRHPASWSAYIFRHPLGLNR